MGYLAITIWSTVAGLVVFSILFAYFLPSEYDHDQDTKDEEKARADRGTIKADRRVRPVTVQILVLGDIGRSPRMQYHARSIAKNGGIVHLIGYHESPLHPDLVENPRVTLYPLAAPPGVLRSIPFIVSGPLKVLWQAVTLLRALFYRTPASKYLLVQNPPSIPTLAFTGLVTIFRRTYIIVDWHNYGWSILANTKGPNHPFVSLAKAHEAVLGRAVPFYNITVTEAMKKDLQGPPYHIPETMIVTLHDRPADIFQPWILDPEKFTVEEEVHARKVFLERLPQIGVLAEDICYGDTKLLMSSTSWTPDEDFSLLLDALVLYAQSPRHPPTIAIITGKGPQKAHYEARIRELEMARKLPGVFIFTAWLSLEDYAHLLSCAELGICLHKSTSGVDLPMKIVDMFGASCPVIAYSAYESFSELVKEGDNGCGFETAEELAGILLRLLSKGGETELLTLRKGATRESWHRWNKEWNRVIGPMLGLTVPTLSEAFSC